MLKIGISASFMHADQPRAIFQGMTLQYIEQNVAHWLMQRDVLAFMVPSPDGSTRRSGSGVTVDDYARELDALVLMGGSDVCPETYGETALRPAWNGDRIRDVYEIALLRAFVAAGKPALGLCRGMQVINVAMGGSLYQDIPTQRPDALRHRMQSIYASNCHATSIVPGSRTGRTLPARGAREDQFRAPPGGEGPGTRPGRRSLVRAGPHRRSAALERPVLPVRRTVAPGVSSARRPTFIDDTPLLDDFLATASRHKSAAYAL